MHSGKSKVIQVKAKCNTPLFLHQRIILQIGTSVIAAGVIKLFLGVCGSPCKSNCKPNLEHNFFCHKMGFNKKHGIWDRL